MTTMNHLHKNPNTTMQALLAPKASDKRYTKRQMDRISLICRSDSYKFSHSFAYPDDKFSPIGQVIGMSSYGTARVKPDVTVVPTGMQMLVVKFLTQRITLADIDAAEEFSVKHFGRKLFAREDWEKVVNEYDGYLPLIIRAIPEGTPVKGGQPIYTVTCLDEDLFWMSAYFETLIQRGVWYPTTIASMDYDIKQEIKRFYTISGADMGLLPFALHDFGGRGVTCGEQAEIGGAAHLLSFMGSDTVEGVLAANYYYNEEMAGFSVFATEHSIECSFGLDVAGEHAYLSHVLKNAAPGVIVSIVIDGKDVLRCAAMLCAKEADGGFRERIIASGAKVVFRPDSGDMMEIVPKILRMQAAAFGTEDRLGLGGVIYKKIKHVGIIQGDGVDHMAIKTLLGNVLAMGFTACCVIFGSGGALLQKVNRDTYKFAQKAASILVRKVVLGAHGGAETESWVGISKDPVTDPGKKSLEGVLTIGRNTVTGELKTLRLDQGIPAGWEDAHVLVYHTGTLYNETTLAEMRGRLE